MSSYILLFLLALGGCCADSSSSDSSLRVTVVPPLRQGADVALLLVVGGGGQLERSDYHSLVRTIQRVHPGRLWVAIGDDYFNKLLDDPLGFNLGLEHVFRQMVAQGMPAETPFFLAGHSFGAQLLNLEILSREDPGRFSGMIFLGSSMALQDVGEFPIPAIMVAGDMDGLSRLGRAALNFRVLMEKEKSQPAVKLTNAIVVLSGVNHYQFASGEIKPSLPPLPDDIPAETDNSTARVRIASAVRDFMVYHSQIPKAQTTSSSGNLIRYFHENVKRFRPFFAMYDLEQTTSGESTICPLSPAAQTLLAQELGGRLNVSDEVYETEFEFMFSKPSITAKGRRAEITTATYLSISNPTHAGASNISADQIALKMKNKDAILKEIGVTNAKNNPISCREINDAIWRQAWEVSSPLAKERFRKRGLVINSMEDIRVSTGFEWVPSLLTFSLNDRRVDIQSTSLVTPADPDIAPYDGMCYCKLLSPARALEFIYIDSLYLTPL